MRAAIGPIRPMGLWDLFGACAYALGIYPLGSGCPESLVPGTGIYEAHSQCPFINISCKRQNMGRFSHPMGSMIPASLILWAHELAICIGGYTLPQMASPNHLSIAAVFMLFHRSQAAASPAGPTRTLLTATDEPRRILPPPEESPLHPFCGTRSVELDDRWP
jgi:hypothetical protein